MRYKAQRKSTRQEAVAYHINHTCQNPQIRGLAAYSVMAPKDLRPICYDIATNFNSTKEVCYIAVSSPPHIFARNNVQSIAHFSCYSQIHDVALSLSSRVDQILLDQLKRRKGKQEFKLDCNQAKPTHQKDQENHSANRALKCPLQRSHTAINYRKKTKTKTPPKNQKKPIHCVSSLPDVFFWEIHPEAHIQE